MRTLRNWLNRIEKLETATGVDSEFCACGLGENAVFVIEPGDPEPEAAQRICEKCKKPIEVATFIVEIAGVKGADGPNL